VLDVLRPGVLDGVSACVVGRGGDVARRLGALGASVAALDADLADEDAVAAAVGALGRIDVLVVDAAGPFAAAGAGMAGLRAAVDGGWNAVPRGRQRLVVGRAVGHDDQARGRRERRAVQVAVAARLGEARP
jgi:hypothetical protein